MMTMTTIIRATLTVDNPHNAALAFSAVLAVDKGFTSSIVREGSARLVVASDGQAVRFSKVKR